MTKSSVKRTYRTYVFYIPTVPIARRRHSYVRETERETHTQLPSQKIIWESEKKITEKTGRYSLLFGTERVSDDDGKMVKQWLWHN